MSIEFWLGFMVGLLGTLIGIPWFILLIQWYYDKILGIGK